MKKIRISFLLLAFLAFTSQGIVFAEEFYQDENGVWTNRPRSDTSGKSEINISGGLNVISRGLVEGAIGIMDSTVGEASREAIRSIGEKSARERGASAYKALRDSGAAQAYGDFMKGASDEYMADWRCKNRGICPGIMGGVNLDEYERFDEEAAKEFKSDWEFYEDPR